jgi:hypothetical protein
MIIRPFRDGDEDVMRELFRACFGKEMSHEEWTWKYKNSYLGTSSVVADDNGRIIAHYGGIKMCFYWKGESIEAYQGCDAMTHPEHQSRGIILKTALGFYEANEGRQFMFGFPSERHASLSARWLGWEKYVFINEMKKEATRVGVQTSFWRTEKGWDKISAVEIDALWEKIKDSRDLSLEKKSNYIFWRYRDRPGKKYEIVLFRGLATRDLKAYAVVLEQNDELQILDLIGTRGVKIKKIMSYLERMTAALGIKTIRLWMNPREQACSELRDAGYVEEKGIPLTLRVFKRSDIIPEHFFERYNYGMGDYDAA